MGSCFSLDKCTHGLGHTGDPRRHCTRIVRSRQLSMHEIFKPIHETAALRRGLISSSCSYYAKTHVEESNDGKFGIWGGICGAPYLSCNDCKHTRCHVRGLKSTYIEKETVFTLRGAQSIPRNLGTCISISRSTLDVRR